jgi:hypothetical protein
MMDLLLLLGYVLFVPFFFNKAPRPMEGLNEFFPMLQAVLIVLGMFVVILEAVVSLLSEVGGMLLAGAAGPPPLPGGALAPQRPQAGSLPVVICPHCRRNVVNDGTMSGQVVACPHCTGQFRMPAPV